jgi:hypothetical protein
MIRVRGRIQEVRWFPSCTLQGMYWKFLIPQATLSQIFHQGAQEKLKNQPNVSLPLPSREQDLSLWVCWGGVGQVSHRKGHDGAARPRVNP